MKIANKLKILALILCCIMCVSVAVACTGDTVTPQPPQPAAPVISMTESETLFVNETFYVLKGVTASDEADGDITHKLTYSVDGGQTINNGVINFTAAGNYIVTYRVTNSAGLETSKAKSVKVNPAEVTDVTAPVILGCKDVLTVPGREIYILSGVSAHDETDGDVTGSITVDYPSKATVSPLGVAVFDEEGTYTVTVKASDAAGNKSEKKVTVKVDEEADDRARLEFATSGTSSHDLTTYTVNTQEKTTLYPGGATRNTEALRISNLNSNSYTFIDLNIEEYDFLNASNSMLNFYIYYGDSTVKSIGVALSQGAERRSVAKGVTPTATASPGWYSVSLRFSEFSLYAAGKVDSVRLTMSYSSSEADKYIIIDELTVDMVAGAIRAPQLTLDGNTVRWDAVENAAGYSIRVDGTVKVESTTATEYSLSWIDATGYYDVDVKAIGAGELYLDSGYSDTVTYRFIKSGESIGLTAPEVTKNKHTLSWQAVRDADFYNIYIDGVKSDTAATTSYMMNVSDSQPHLITVTADSNSSDYTESPESNSLIYTNIADDAESGDLTNSMTAAYGISSSGKDYTRNSISSFNSVTAVTTLNDGNARYGALIYNFGEMRDLTYATISFDTLIVTNISENISVIVFDGSSSTYQITVKISVESNSNGVKVERIMGGWMRVTIDCFTAFVGKNADQATIIRIGFSNNVDTSKEGVISLDNLSYVINEPDLEEGDLITSLYYDGALSLSSIAPGGIATVTDTVYYTNSSQSVKLTLNAGYAENRPTLKIAYSGSLVGKELEVYFKTEGLQSSGKYFGVMISGSNDRKDAQVTAAENGWSKATMNFDTSFVGYNITALTEIRLVFDKLTADAAAVWLDGMSITDAAPTGPSEADDLSGVFSHAVYNRGGTAATALGYYTGDVADSAFSTKCVRLDVTNVTAEGKELIQFSTDSGHKNLTGKIISMYVKVDGYVAGSVKLAMYLRQSSSSGNGSSLGLISYGSAYGSSGWNKVMFDLDSFTELADFNYTDISYIRVGCDRSTVLGQDAYTMIDHLTITDKPDAEPDEADDLSGILTTGVYHTSGGAATTTVGQYTQDVYDSTKSTKCVRLDVTNVTISGRTLIQFDLTGEDRNLSGKTITFYIKTDGYESGSVRLVMILKQSSSLGSGTSSNLTVNGTAYGSDGWYKATFDLASFSELTDFDCSSISQFRIGNDRKSVVGQNAYTMIDHLTIA